MSAFRFRLEAPLRLARLKRQEGRRELSEAVQAGIKLKDLMSDAATGKREAHDELLRRAEAGVAGLVVAQIASHRERHAFELRVLAQQAGAIEQAESAARDRLSGHSRQVNVLEGMKNRAWADHARALNAREQAELDDLTLQRHAARRMTR